MKTIILITKVIGLLIFTSGVNSSFAEQIQVSTTFSCSTNAECKRKCEALGSDHTWKPNPGGSTLGTCTKKSQLSPPSKATLDSLSTVNKNSKEIYKELNYLFSKSPIVKKLGLKGAQINSISIMFKNNNDNDNERICASCLGDGFAVEMCCKRSEPNCAFPCLDGVVPIMGR